jgi:hypothetical protein
LGKSEEKMEGPVDSFAFRMGNIVPKSREGDEKEKN